MKFFYAHPSKNIVGVLGLMKDQYVHELMNIFHNKHDKEDDYNDIVKLA